MKKMKYRYIIMWLLSLLTACMEDVDPSLLPHDALQLSASIGEIEQTRAVMDERTGVGTFAIGDAILLNTWQGTPRAAIDRNKEYILSATGWNPAVATNQIFWEDLAFKATTFTACFPKKEMDVNGTLAHTVATDQSAAGSPYTAYEQSDLLFASTTTDGGKVDLAFSHLLTRLVINVDATTGGGYTDADVANKLKVVVLNMKPACTLNTSDGTIKTIAGTAPANGLTPRLLTAKMVDTVAVSYSAILIPQPVVEGAAFIRLTLADNTTYTLNIPPTLYNELTGKQDAFTFLPAGKQLTLNLQLSKTGISLSASYVGVWGSVGKIQDNTRPFPGVYTAQDLVNISRDWVSTDGGKAAGTLSAGYVKNYVTVVGGKNVIKIWKDISFDAASNAAFRPIGQTVPFTYDIDGQNYTISGLTLNAANASGNNVGLIGQARDWNVIIQNVRMKDVSIDVTGSGVGALVGLRGTVRNCHVSGASHIKSTANTVGGIAGWHTMVQGCSVVGTELSGTHNIGGIIGLFQAGAGYRAVLLNCAVIGGVISGSGNIGGVAGNIVQEYIRNSYSTAQVKGVGTTAGICGTDGGNGMGIHTCYYAGAVVGTYVLAGPAVNPYTSCFWSSSAGVGQANGTKRGSGPFSPLTGLTLGGGEGDIAKDKSILNQLNVAVESAVGRENGYQYWELKEIDYYYMATGKVPTKGKATLPVLSGRVVSK